ncbi:MAG: hypothetical protein DMG12_26785 [Acidobacteria bacterium]|nr:MAG: hypothetical protein DMG12_26785 [Acidobacteriota bacterium]
MNALTRMGGLVVRHRRREWASPWLELAGPEAIPFDKLVRKFLKANRDPRTVITRITAGMIVLCGPPR